ncbi:kielin/chordin-like protein isoform X2 [Ostrea edulis]|uniref:kielin/chordin-like protein isoform X2 n=1 Tax=Ostrea edulis TaxID=37623 RepID=UPI0024AEFF7B|nr:kielin/chordin-like protein isoform X2 [Ostrea edulis]
MAISIVLGCFVLSLVLGADAVCNFDGVSYSIGDTRIADDGCNLCTCTATGMECTKGDCTFPRELTTTTTVPQTGGCHYNGKTYWAGQSFRAVDGCNTCYCSAHGGALCTEMFCQPMLLCHYNGTDHKPGTSYSSTDGCNTCTCTHGGLTACTEMACMKRRGCTYNGRHHEAGVTFRSVDGCNTCTCAEDGTYSCTTEPCLSEICNYNGKEFKVGEAFQADDGCNRCFCTAGGVAACTKMYCPPSTAASKS